MVRDRRVGISCGHVGLELFASVAPSFPLAQFTFR